MFEKSYLFFVNSVLNNGLQGEKLQDEQTNKKFIGQILSGGRASRLSEMENKKGWR